MTTIREMTEQDIPVIYSYGTGESRFTVCEGSSGFWSIEQLTRWVANERDVLLVAEEDSRIVGYTLSHTHEPTGKTEYENLHVLSDCRGRGIATELMMDAIRINEERGTTYHVGLVEPDNAGSLKALGTAGMTPQATFVWVDKKC
jgi:ribosomal protein S18 acetylase RimI-like enzyme